MMRKHKIGLSKRILAAILSVLLAASLVGYGGGAVTVRAAESIEYLDEKGNLQICSENTIAVTSETTTWNSGWYVVNGDVEIQDRITVSGTVNLILADNCTMTASSGITVNEGKDLTIYMPADHL